ncbi:PfkB family carbohydrate kinase [Candidatus Marinimicrobia bacterium]|nr:PfkB family carbohydrate kinase [Candidatus Neomarinimicrobiota bacterium]
MKLDFSNIKVLLIGDFMIDHYLMGISNRMSPEAPVPVVVQKEEYSIPGGAGNVAMNLSSMGANVTCMGVVGNDNWGKKLLSILNNHNINTDYINRVDNHTTTLKQRIYSNGKQVARIDQEKYFEWNPPEGFDYMDYDVIILSDYNKGFINNINISGDLIIADPKKDNFSLYRNSHIITPNLNELQQATSINIKDDQSIVDACNDLIQKNNFDYIVAKKGNEGMTIVGKNNFVKHISAEFVENPDVTGAGDTVISVLSIVYAQTRDIEISAKIANIAAAIVVGKPGTAMVTVDELRKLALL